MRPKISFLLAALLAIFFYACNKNDQDAIKKSQFSYTGNNDLIATIINQLKSTDFSGTLQAQFPDTKPGWDKYASYRRMSDSTLTVLVPLMNGNDTVRNYLKIDFDVQSQHIAKVSYYNYERDYLNNSSKYRKALIGMDLKYLTGTSSLLPATFVADSALAFYVKQATKRFRQAAKNTRLSNALSKKAGLNTLSAKTSSDFDCDVMVYCDFDILLTCSAYEIKESFERNLEISLNIKANEIGATYILTNKDFPDFTISCSASLGAYMESIFENALNLTSNSAPGCYIGNEIIYITNTCQNDPGDGGGDGDDDDDDATCEKFENNMSSGVSEVFLSSDLDYDNEVSRTKIYSWVFYAQDQGLWRFISKEEGLHLNDNGVWKWAGLEHKSAEIDGWVIGGTITLSGVFLHTVPGIYNYGAELHYTLTFSPVAKGCPSEKSVGFISRIIFNVND